MQRHVMQVTAIYGNATAIGCTDVLVRSKVEGQSIVGIGLGSIVSVAMPNAGLICQNDRVQDVKIAVQMLKYKGFEQAEFFPKVHRPWGWFESIAMGDRLQVKRIVANPGKLPMILIEVQTGSYLGKDDVIRHEDHYAGA